MTCSRSLLRDLASLHQVNDREVDPSLTVLGNRRVAWAQNGGLVMEVDLASKNVNETGSAIGYAMRTSTRSAGQAALGNLGIAWYRSISGRRPANFKGYRRCRWKSKHVGETIESDNNAGLLSPHAQTRTPATFVGSL